MNKAPDNPLTTHVAAAPIERAQAAQQQPGADKNTVNMETQYTYSEPGQPRITHIQITCPDNPPDNPHPDNPPGQPIG